MSVLRLTPERYAVLQKKAHRAPQTDTGRAFPASGVQPPSKYRNRATGGYASVKEARRAGELKLMQQAGEITELAEQVKYVLIPTQRDTAGNLLEKEASYYADFQYKRDGELVVEDVKGRGKNDGADWKLFVFKRKLMLHVHGIRIRET